MSKTILLVGLGNPGKDYANTRHNAGFLALDSFVSAIHKDAVWQLKKDFQAEIATLETNGKRFLCAKPQTFMNKSGESVGAITRFYRLEPDDIWVIHDDLDLPLGKAQVRKGGGLAGHNGLESIQQHLSTADFGRVRLGIRGHELRAYHEEKGIDTNQFVMSTFTPRENEILEKVFGTLPHELTERDMNESHTITVDGYETFETSREA